MAGYAGQFAAYEGLTVNFAEAVQSAGGSILSPAGSRATLTSPQARRALELPGQRVPQGWIPQAALGWDEEASRRAFEAGQAAVPAQLALRLRRRQRRRDPATRWPGKFGVTTLPGPDGPGSSSLGGANLAVSAFSQHPSTALAFIRFLTSLPSERQVLIDTSLPPVWTRLYAEPALVRRFPYLPVLKQAILAARPRPEIASYNQLSLAISSAVHRALAQQVSVTQTLTSLNSQLNQILRTKLTRRTAGVTRQIRRWPHDTCGQETEDARPSRARRSAWSRRWAWRPAAAAAGRARARVARWRRAPSRRSCSPPRAWAARAPRRKAAVDRVREAAPQYHGADPVAVAHLGRGAAAVAALLHRRLGRRPT